MSYPKAVLAYEMNTEQFVPAANTAERALEQIKGKAKDTEKEIANLERKVSQTQQRVAASFTGMVANVGSLAFSFRDLGDSQVQIDTLELKMRKLRASMNDTTLSADKLAIKNEELRLLGERHADAVENQEKAYWQFGLSMVTMATTSIPATIAAVTQMRAAQHALAAAHATTAGAAVAHTAANTGLTLSFRGLTAAMMSNPLGLALVAVSIGALAIYSTNLGGIKDKVDGLIGSFGGASSTSSQFHTEMKSGTAVLNEYSTELDGLTAAVNGVLEVQQKEIFKRALSKDSTLIGSVDQYKQLDSILNTASSEMQVMLKYEKDVDSVLEKIVAKHSDELDALGATNQFLERRLRLHLQIEESQERLAKREREESKKKRDEENQNVFDRERAAIQLEKELRMLEAVPMSLRPVFGLLESMKLLDPRDLAGGRQIQSMIERIDALQSARFAQIMVSAFPQDSFSSPMSSSFRTVDFNGRTVNISVSNMNGRSGSQRARTGGGRNNRKIFNPENAQTSGGRAALTIRKLLDGIPDYMYGPLGTSRSVILNNAQRVRAEYDKLVNDLAQWGLGIPGPTMLGRGGKGHVPFYADDASQNLANVIAEMNRRKEAKISPYRDLGFGDSAILGMLATSQGYEDLAGIKLAKQLASLA